MVAQHLNWSLPQNGSSDLITLRGDSDFVIALETKIKDPHFVQGALRQDLTTHDHVFTTYLLFAYDFINTHSSASVSPAIDAAFASAPSGTLINSWGSATFDGLDQNTQVTTALNLAKATSLVHAVTNDAGQVAPVPLNTQFQALSTSNILPGTVVDPLAQALQTLVQSDTDAWQSIAAESKVLWDNDVQRWATAVFTVLQETTSTQIPDGQPGQTLSEVGKEVLGVLSWHPVTVQQYQVTTITGQGVADWINEGVTKFTDLFNSNAPGVSNTQAQDVSTSVLPSGSCFIKGTKVAVQGGAVAIEDLTEGMRVLTGANPESYGMASDEDVVVPLSSALLCGINDDPPFFTAGHVFHTTSGLRAINPDAARSENPWLRVGPLKAGHILYRLKADKKGYDQVDVRKITQAQVTGVEVHGLHLREGNRSYHANGYLVAVNYPEVTVKSIARMLTTFTKGQQIGFLRNIRELDPLFARFGAATMSDVLTAELNGLQRSPNSSPLIRKPRLGRTAASNLALARRTFSLQELNRRNVSDYHLPSTLAVHEGGVLLDGLALHRARIDDNGRTIRWTRSIPHGGFEHGYVDLLDHGMGGNGVIVLSDDADLRQLPEGRQRKVVTFHAALTDDKKLPATHIADTAKSPAATNPVAPGTSAGGQTPRLRTAVAVSHPLTRTVPIPGLVRTTPLLAAATHSDPKAVTMSPTIEASVAPGSTDYIDATDPWILTLDQDIWPVGQNKSTSSKPVPFGTFNFAVYHSGGVDGFPVPIVTVPLLDQLCQEINNKYLSGKNQIQSLYSSTVEITSKGTQLGRVYLDKAAMLYELADKGADNKLSSMLNVSFTKTLGSLIVLPVFFRTLGLEISNDFTSLRGAALEYDPTCRGGEGQRHFVQDSDSVPQAAAAIAMASRSNVSKQMAAFRSQPVSMSDVESSPALNPAPVTTVMAAEQPLSTGLLTNLQGYSSVDVHSTSLALIQDAMLYHMNADNRTTFLQQTAPSTLPIELGENLPDELKTWIQDTYAPAFIGQMVALNDDSTVKLRDPLSEDEKAKLTYWWRGAGETCLSKSSAYNQLNGLASVYAMRQLYGSTLSPFIDDGGSKWAQKLLDDVTRSQHAFFGYLNVPTNGGENVLNKYCNIFNALDSTGTYADQFFNHVVAFAIKNNISNPLFPLDQEAATQQKEWLNDTMKQLVIMVLNNDSKLPGSVKDGLRSDLQQLGFDLSQPEKSAEEFVTQAAELTARVISAMDAIKTGLGALARCNCFKAAAASVNNAIGKIAPAEGKVVAMKGIMVLAVAAGYVITSVNTFKNFTKLDGTQKTLAIISLLTMVVETAGQSLSVWEDFKKWRGGEKPPAAEAPPELGAEDAVPGEQLDEALQESLGSAEGAEKLNAISIECDKSTLKDTFMETMFNEPEQPTRSANLISDGVEDIQPAAKIEEEASKADPEPVEALTGPAKAGWKTFSASERVLKGLGVALGLAFTVAMSFELKNNWDHLNNVGKILSVLQVVAQGMTVLVDAAILIGDVAITEGFLVADSVLMVALPVVGAVLAVLGVVLMGLLSYLHVNNPPDPPLSPVEQYLQDTGHPFIAKLGPAPSLTLTYNVSPSPLPANSTTTSMMLTATNTTASDVTLTNTTIKVEVGSDSKAVFAGPTTAPWTAAGGFDPSTPSSLSVPGTIGVAPSSRFTAKVTQQNMSTGLFECVLAVLGPPIPGSSTNAGQLVVPKGQSISMAFLGVISAVGSSTLSIVESLVNGDNCTSTLSVARA